MANCPKCDSPVLTVDMDEVTMSAIGSRGRRGLALSCPHCHVLLSVSMDPISVKADVVIEVVEQLRQMLRSK